TVGGDVDIADEPPAAPGGHPGQAALEDRAKGRGLVRRPGRSVERVQLLVGDRVADAEHGVVVHEGGLAADRGVARTVSARRVAAASRAVRAASGSRPRPWATQAPSYSSIRRDASAVGSGAPVAVASSVR